MEFRGDCEMMDRWFDGFGYNIEEVLEAELTAGSDDHRPGFVVPS